MRGLRIGRLSATPLADVRQAALGKHARHLRGDHAETTRHWAAWFGDELIGCVSVMEIRGVALRGMAVMPDWQRKGVGSDLLRAVHEEVDGAMWCNARASAVTFYAAHGWTAVGPSFVMSDGGEHQRMVWAAQERKSGSRHERNLKSPITTSSSVETVPSGCIVD